jgi:hypothetical protein
MEATMRESTYNEAAVINAKRKSQAWVDAQSEISAAETSSSFSSEDNMRGDKPGVKVIVQSQQSSDLSQLTCSSMHEFSGSLHSHPEHDKKACHVHTMSIPEDSQRQVTGCV